MHIHTDKFYGLKQSKSVTLMKVSAEHFGNLIIVDSDPCCYLVELPSAGYVASLHNPHQAEKYQIRFRKTSAFV